MADRNGTIQGESEDRDPGQSVHKPENEAPDSWRKFFVLQAGKTNGAHESVVKTFESSGQTQVETSKDADYCLLFCPVSTRVGTDVGYAMELLENGKEAVLVVMHHTFNPEQVIPPSRRLVDERRVRLTLDCLFYQNKLLRCEFNDKMKANIKKFFRSSILEFSRQTDPSGQTAPGQNDETEAGRDSGRKLKRGTGWFRMSHYAETSHQSMFNRFIPSIFGRTETHVNKRESQNDNPNPESRSDPGSVPPNRSGSLDHQGAPPPQSESGTNDSSKTEASKRPEEDDLPTNIINAIMTKHEEEIATLKQQHETEILKKDEEMKNLKNAVAELQKQQSALEDGPAPPDSRGGPGPLDGPGTGLHRSEDGASGSTEASGLQQVDSSHDIRNPLHAFKAEMGAMKLQHQRVVDELKREIVKRDEKIEELQNVVAKVEQHLGRLVDSQSNTGSGPPGGPGESGSPDHQETGPPQSEHVSDDSSNMETGSGPAEPGSGGDPGPLDQQDAPPPRPEDGTQNLWFPNESSPSASWRKFFVLTGQTHGPCRSVIKTFKKSLGQTEVDSPEDADYWLVFCTVSPQVENDIMEVMERLPNGKEAVLVVMHQTAKPEEEILLSVKLENERRVRLTLNCLFYQNKLLKCKLNDKMKADILKFLRSSTPEVP